MSTRSSTTVYSPYGKFSSVAVCDRPCHQTSQKQPRAKAKMERRQTKQGWKTSRGTQDKGVEKAIWVYSSVQRSLPGISQLLTIQPLSIHHTTSYHRLLSMTAPSMKLSKIDPKQIQNFRNSAEAWLEDSYCTPGRERAMISGLRPLWKRMKTCITVTCICVSTPGLIQRLYFPES